MSAKKKRTRPGTVGENNVRLRARLGELLADHFKDVDRIAALEKKLAKANELLKSDAVVIVELSEKVTRTERAYDAEVAFWKKEVEHLQQRAVDAVLAAVKK